MRKINNKISSIGFNDAVLTNKKYWIITRNFNNHQEDYFSDHSSFNHIKYGRAYLVSVRD
jgi:hypothetical protein